MPKVHYPCGGWADNTGARPACVRKVLKKPPSFDGRATHVTCKKCLYRAIPKNSQWNSLIEPRTMTVKKLSRSPSGYFFVMFKSGGFLLVKDFVATYEPRL